MSSLPAIDKALLIALPLSSSIIQFFCFSFSIPAKKSEKPISGSSSSGSSVVRIILSNKFDINFAVSLRSSLSPPPTFPKTTIFFLYLQLLIWPEMLWIAIGVFALSTTIVAGWVDLIRSHLPGILSMDEKALISSSASKPRAIHIPKEARIFIAL